MNNFDLDETAKIMADSESGYSLARRVLQAETERDQLADGCKSEGRTAARLGRLRRAVQAMREFESSKGITDSPDDEATWDGLLAELYAAEKAARP